jgi:glycosyltransferase involved in cell wall biosynthesis
VGDSRTLVFVPAWNEEANLPAVLDELAAEVPGTDVLVVDDGSTDKTAEVASERGAEVLSFGANRGLRAAIAAGWDYAAREGYELCGRVDADGQHPAAELRRLLERVESGECDVAFGSRFVTADGYEAQRYKPDAVRRLGTGVLRRAFALRTGTRFADATSGMYAARAEVFPVLARPYTSGAPEVEGLMRLTHEGFRVEEVAVHMRQRASGESKLVGKKAFLLVLTVAATLLLGKRMRGR